MEDDHAIRNPSHEIQVVLDQDDRHPGLDQAPEDLADHVALVARQPGGRLVEQQQLGAHGGRGRKLEPLLEAVRKRR